MFTGTPVRATVPATRPPPRPYPQYPQCPELGVLPTQSTSPGSTNTTAYSAAFRGGACDALIDADAHGRALLQVRHQLACPVPSPPHQCESAGACHLGTVGGAGVGVRVVNAWACVSVCV